MPKTVTIRLDEETYAIVKAAASADRRSVANLIETATLRHIEESSFMDAAEAAEILSDPALTKRLKTGHAQASAGNGRFVRET